MRVTVEDETGRKVTVEPGGAPEWDGVSVAGRVVKSDDERRYTLCVVYPADKADVSVAADGHRDFASKQAVEEACWAFTRKARALTVGDEIGAWHEDGTEGAGEKVENYIYRGPDWEIEASDGSKQVVKSGDWLMGIVWDPATWALIKARHITGVSMQGTAKRRAATPEAIEGLRS